MMRHLQILQYILWQSLSTIVDYQNGVASTNKSINIRANRETGTFGASDPTCGHT